MTRNQAISRIRQNSQVLEEITICRDWEPAETELSDIKDRCLEILEAILLLSASPAPQIIEALDGTKLQASVDGEVVRLCPAEPLNKTDNPIDYPGGKGIVRKP